MQRREPRGLGLVMRCDSTGHADGQHGGPRPRQSGHHRTVSPVRLGAGDLAAQDRDLMPQDQDLVLAVNRILRLTWDFRGCQAARSYSLIRPLRTGFRRIWHVPDLLR